MAFRLSFSSPMNTLKLCSIMAFAVIGFFLLSEGVRGGAKSELSTFLIDRAWNKTLKDAGEHKPWPWVESAPVAQIGIPRLEEDYIVMSGVSGSVLKYAPGWHDGTVMPGHKGISLIAAQKDTHFSNLKNLIIGDRIFVQTPDGLELAYRVGEIQMVEDHNLQIEKPNDISVLILMTSYSVGNWDDGDEMRIAVIARIFDEYSQPDLLAMGEQ